MRELRPLPFCFCLLSLPALAAEPAADATELEYAVQLGGAVAYKKGLIRAQDHLINGEPLLLLALDVQYHNFFLESSNHRFGARLPSGTLGYRLWHNEQQDLSLIGYSPHDQIDPEAESLFDDGPIKELAGLERRRADMMWGLRYQHSNGEHYWMAELTQDSDAHYSQQLQLLYSKRQQLRNWDLYYNASWVYTPAKLVNYYYGVRPNEVTVGRPAYQAGAGTQFSVSLTALYPLSEQWLFEGSVGTSFYSKSYRDSPLTNRNNDFLLLLSARYVF